MLRPALPADVQVRCICCRRAIRGRDAARLGFVLGVIATAVTCLACLTPVAVLVLGAIGLGAWTGRLDLVLLTLLVGFVLLGLYRYRGIRRR